jgi:hypothetical protein
VFSSSLKPAAKKMIQGSTVYDVAHYNNNSVKVEPFLDVGKHKSILNILPKDKEKFVSRKRKFAIRLGSTTIEFAVIIKSIKNSLAMRKL